MQWVIKIRKHRKLYDKTLKKECNADVLSIYISENLKNLVLEQTKKGEVPKYTNKCVQKILNILDTLNLKESNGRSTINLTKTHDKNIDKKVYKYTKEFGIFISRGEFVRFSVFYDIINKKEELIIKQQQEECQTVESYLKKKGLKIKGDA